MFGKLILLVFVVMAILMVVPSTRANLEDRARPVMDSFKGKLVPRRLETMADQLEVRVGRGEGFPTSWDGWLERSFSGAPEDPWGNRYYIVNTRRDFTVGSMGPDAKQGNEDDITETRSLGR